MTEIFYHPSVQTLLRTCPPPLGQRVVASVLDLKGGKAVEASDAGDIAPGAIELCFEVQNSIQLSIFYIDYRERPVVFFARRTSDPSTRDEDLVDHAQNALHECMLTLDALLDHS